MSRFTYLLAAVFFLASLVIAQADISKKTASGEGPQMVKKYSTAPFHMVAIDPHYRTVAAVNRSSTGSIDLYDAKAQLHLGVVNRYARDVMFDGNGRKLAGTWKKQVFQIDVSTGTVDWSFERDGNVDYSELAYSPDDTRVIVGDDEGVLSVFDAATGKLLSTHKTVPGRVTDLAIGPNGRVLVGTQAGLFGADLTDLDRSRMTQSKPEKVYYVAFVDGGASFAALYSDQTLISGSNTQKLEEMVPDKTVLTKTGAAYSFAVAPGGREILLAGTERMVSYSVPELVEGTSFANDVVGQSGSTVYLGTSGAFLSQLGKKGLASWAPTGALAVEVSRVSKSLMGDARLRRDAMEKSQKQAASEYANKKAQAKYFYDTGDCASYASIKFQLEMADQKEDCQANATLRENLKQYKSALSEKRCSDAEELRTLLGITSRLAVKDCLVEQKRNEEQARFSAAMAAKDCAVVAELAVAVGKPEAEADCALEAAMTADSARAMYFAAVKFDADLDRTRAKKLYAAIMTRFPEDDIALTAASRLTSINDIEVMEKKQSESEAALAKAQAAIEKANQEKVEAERRTQKALAQAEAARNAAEARAREAEARAKAQANSQPRRNTACDHVAPGMYFEYQGGGLFGVANGRWQVIGISREGGFVTARKTGQDFQRQISCGKVR